MAEIILTAVINKSTEIAGNLLVQEGSRLYWLKEDIYWLRREMRHIRSYIDDATTKVVEGDSRVKNFIKDIQELAGDVEDLLDEFLPKIHDSHKSKGAIGFLKQTAGIPFQASFAHKFAMEIEKIKRRVVEIDRVRTTYNIMDTSTNNNQYDNIPMDRRRLFLHADETEVIGLDDDFNILQAKLLDQGLQYGVISIVGMPGLGKTTLAKKLYRHVRNQFECSALVYVSQQPRVGEILLDIAKQIGLREEERKDNLENSLQSFLKRKRYVILLDDIWNIEIWDDLKLFLSVCESKNGCKIIITSRNNYVGRYIGGESSLHVLQPLDFEKSFELFTKNIFNFDDNNWVNAPLTLKNIGKEIVKRCAGIPLAIVLTAGMLRTKERIEHTWNKVLENMSNKIQDGCAKIMTLSYNNLPSALRPCFLYFGLFPEDYEILAFDLTNMWIADNVIVVSSGNRQEAEDMAENVLNDLVSRNLIQVARRTYEGRIASCRIHDLLHNLCVILAEENNFFHTKNNTCSDPASVARLRRMTFYTDNADVFFCSNVKPKKLRTLFCFTNDPCTLSLIVSHGFKFLHVLSVVMPPDYIEEVIVPNEIGNMSCLRYLKLEGRIYGNLPSNITKLKHLETLDVEKSYVGLPSRIWELKQLRHLCHGKFDIYDEYFCIGALCRYNMSSSNLQTLLWINDIYIKPRLWHGLTNLRKLGLRGVSDSTIKILSSPMPILPKLEILKLDFSGDTSEPINLSCYQNLVKLYVCGPKILPINSEAFPPNLVKITLRYLSIDGHPPPALKKLPKLRILKIDDCIYNEGTMNFSGDVDSFPRLEVLHIQEQQDFLSGITVDDISMPKLNKVILRVGHEIRLSERLAKLRI